VTQSGVALTACGHYSDFGQRDSIVSMARGSFVLSTAMDALTNWPWQSKFPRVTEAHRTRGDSLPR